MADQFNQFRSVLLGLGATDRERAAVLKLTPRQIWNLKRKGPPAQFQRYTPELLRAIAADLEAQTVELQAA